MKLATFFISVQVTVLLIFTSLTRNISGENILFFHLMGTASHRTTIWPLAEQLASKGHNVTYIWPLKKRIGSHPQIEEIFPSNCEPILNNWLGEFDINTRLNNTILEWMSNAFSKSLDLCQAFYESPEIIELLSRPNLHYDLVMIDQSLGDCVYGLVRKFKAKHILFNPVLVPFIHDGIGIVPESASVPTNLLFRHKPNEMSFWGRVKATFGLFIWRLGYQDYVWKLEPFLKDKLNMTDLPPIAEFERNTSLIMVNNHFIEDYPMSYPPMIIPISGMWCGKNKMKHSKPLHRVCS